ncbi:MAG: hypothetical protein HKN87_07600 [Saprospiraceae bacterium]|nr:hypothetical protein [Saprospiraceae bacterium]
MSTENSIYSFDDLYVNFYRAFKDVPLPKQGSSVLILGLGLASIPYMLEHHFKRHYHYWAVEIDEAVVELAGRYTLPRIQSHIEIYCADAARFVATCEQKFDLVIVDLFLDDVTPSFLDDIEGNVLVKALVGADGFAMYNRLYRSAHDQERTEKFYEEVFKKSFDRPNRLDVGGNWILLGE